MKHPPPPVHAAVVASGAKTAARSKAIKSNDVDPVMKYAAPRSPPVKKKQQHAPAAATPPPPALDLSERKLHRIPITALIHATESIHTHGTYTPLILDPSGRVDTFFSYSQAVIVDVKGILVRTVVMKTQTREDALEELRKSLVNSLRYGSLLVLSFGNSATDIFKFDDDANFPVNVLLYAGGKRLADEEVYEKLLREEDLQQSPNGIFNPKRATESSPPVGANRVVITSLFSVEDHEEFLGRVLPMQKLLPIEILPLQE